MSSDEELIAIGRLVKEHRAASRERALLNAELQRIGKLMSLVGQKLSVTGGLVIAEPQESAEDIEGLPTAEKLRSLLTDFKEAIKAEAALRARLTEAGLS